MLSDRAWWPVWARQGDVPATVGIFIGGEFEGWRRVSVFCNAATGNPVLRRHRVAETIQRTLIEIRASQDAAEPIDHA